MAVWEWFKDVQATLEKDPISTMEFMEAAATA